MRKFFTNLFKPRHETTININVTVETIEVDREPVQLNGLENAKPNQYGNYMIVPVPDAPPPTERQLEYAKDVGIDVPVGACKWDVSSLLDRYEGNDLDPAPQEIIEYLREKKISASSLLGHSAAINAMFWVGDTLDHLAVYAYYIYQNEHGLPVLNINYDPLKEQFYAFADYASREQRLLEHYDRWRNDSGYSTARTWGIYKDLKAYYEAVYYKTEQQ